MLLFQEKPFKSSPNITCPCVTCIMLFKVLLFYICLGALLWKQDGTPRHFHRCTFWRTKFKSESELLADVNKWSRFLSGACVVHPKTCVFLPLDAFLFSFCSWTFELCDYALELFFYLCKSTNMSYLCTTPGCVGWHLPCIYGTKNVIFGALC